MEKFPYNMWPPNLKNQNLGVNLQKFSEKTQFEVYHIWNLHEPILISLPPAFILPLSRSAFGIIKYKNILHRTKASRNSDYFAFTIPAPRAYKRYIEPDLCEEEDPE